MTHGQSLHLFEAASNCRVVLSTITLRLRLPLGSASLQLTRNNPSVTPRDWITKDWWFRVGFRAQRSGWPYNVVSIGV